MRVFGLLDKSTSPNDRTGPVHDRFFVNLASFRHNVNVITKFLIHLANGGVDGYRGKFTQIQKIKGGRAPVLAFRSSRASSPVPACCARCLLRDNTFSLGSSVPGQFDVIGFGARRQHCVDRLFAVASAAKPVTLHSDDLAPTPLWPRLSCARFRCFALRALQWREFLYRRAGHNLLHLSGLS